MSWNTASNTDRIEKQISLRAPQSRVWRALTDHKEFGAWFRVRLESPMTLGAKVKGQITHPRSFGNNARVLGEYVREQKILTLPDAIRKMTSLPASTFKLTDRGVIKPGAWADIVIFDDAKVKDTSTFDDPLHYSEGFTDVLVRGTLVMRDGKMTDAKPGGSLRK